MRNFIEQVLLTLQSFFALFKELILGPLRKILVDPSQREDEIKININITTRFSSQNKTQQNVKFGGLEIRTYETILGDNPSCSRGPPLAIGWKYDPNKVMNLPVDQFENHPSRKDRPQISEFDLLMGWAEREQTLLDLGYAKSEIANATRQILRDKKKRRQTTDNLSATFAEEKMEGFKKFMRRNLLFKKSTKAMYKKWKKFDIASRERGNGSWQRPDSILVLSRECRGDSVSTGIVSESLEEISASDDSF